MTAAASAIEAALAERDRCLADIARYEAIAAERGPGSTAVRMSRWEREHLARVESRLRSAGWQDSL
jgi:hypothetical protein